MKTQYNRRAIMDYAHDLKKHSRLTFSECLRSAWEAAKYIKSWDLQWAPRYENQFELLTGPEITWVPKVPRDPIYDWIEKYGAE